MIGPLLRLASFRRLAIGLTLAMLAESVLLLALGIRVKTLTGSDALAGAVILAIALPSLVAPAMGTWVDRVSRKRFLVVLNIVSAIVLLPLLVVVDADRVGIIFVVAFAYGLAYPLTAAATGGLLKDLVSADALGDANGLLQTVRQGLRLIGPLIGAGLLVSLGPRVLIGAVSVGFLLSAAVLATIAADEAPRVVSAASWTGQMKEGWRSLRENTRLLRVTIAVSGAMLALGLLEPVVFAVADAGLGRPPEFVSVIVFAQGIGSVIGGLTAGRLVRRRGESATVAAALLLAAPAVALWVVPATAAVLVGSGLVGVALRCSAYQITTWPSPWRTIGLPGSHLNAAAKAGRFEGAPTARNCAGACSSVAMRFFSSSGVKLRRHTVAQLRKKRWSRLSPSVMGSGVSPAAAFIAS